VIRKHFIAAIACFIAILFIAGCAVPTVLKDTNEAESTFWHGRLALRAEPNLAAGQTQQQALSAAFELRGNATSGELLLLTPLGSTVAAIRWTPAGAELQAQGSTRQFGDLQQLVLQALGSSVPVSALFIWLHGQATPVDGWQVDLSQSGQGKIVARRDHPEPKAELRLILEQ